MSIALDKHKQWKGKLEVKTKVDLIKNPDELKYCYTPGVAEPCLEIEKDNDLSYTYTGRGNTIAVITDGSAVLGLGNIGPLAGMPVMEGKCSLFKTFGDVDAIPLCIKTNDIEEIVRTIYLLSGSFGGINLEDISAPRCFEIEKRLKEICDIPVFHDDQHGTAIVLGAALINALKVVKKDISKIKVVINGAGAAGVSIAKFILKLGVNNLFICDKSGLVFSTKNCNSNIDINIIEENKKKDNVKLIEVIKNSDVFIGVSGPNAVSIDMVKSMARDAICFPMANPTPEISYEDAIKAGAKVVGTGRSDYPNQINNLLAFPGIFRGALDSRASDINDEMMVGACNALASFIKDEELNDKYIIPIATDKRVHEAVSKAVYEEAIKSKVSKIK